MNQADNEIIASHGFTGSFVTIICLGEVTVENPTGATEVVNQGLTLGSTWIDPELIRYEIHDIIVS